MNTLPNRILVVDDGKMARVLLARQLIADGYDVTETISGEEALATLEPGSFDLVILDVLMPGLGGMATLQKIRERHSFQDLPVIMATAQDQVEGMLKAFELGANDYVIKPVLFPILRARLRTQLALLATLRKLKVAEDRIQALESGGAAG